MRKESLILIAFFIAISFPANAGFKVFVNKNGEFRLFDEKTDIVSTFKPNEDCPKGSFLYYRSCLGYLDGEVISSYNDDCFFIATNTFNDDVIFIIPKDTTKISLSKEEVDSYLANISINEKAFITKLDNGVKERTIRQNFVEKSLGIKSENNTLKDAVHGYVYKFENGFMSDYESDDGLNSDAKGIKSDLPSIFSKIEMNAKTYYGNFSDLVAKYINGQCKYLLHIDMDYLKTAINPNINYNYALLFSILYEGIGLDEFLFLVPGAEIKSSVNKFIIVSYKDHVFTFEDKVLIKD